MASGTCAWDVVVGADADNDVMRRKVFCRSNPSTTTGAGGNGQRTVAPGMPRTLNELCGGCSDSTLRDPSLNKPLFATF